jgi:hypothetical protein
MNYKMTENDKNTISFYYFFLKGSLILLKNLDARAVGFLARLPVSCKWNNVAILTINWLVLTIKLSTILVTLFEDA